jgi:dTDP-glucose pyrophosphorylase
MDKWKNSILHSSNTLLETIQKIDSSPIQFMLVVNSEGRLEGVITDGDIRRAILKGIGLDSKIDGIMNRNPKTVPKNTSKDEILAMMRRHVLHHLPVLDEDGKIFDLITLDDLIGAAEKSNVVVLMAGGLGKRLRPLTDEMPKPLLPLGGKPILENILLSFYEQGFRKFYFSINYKGNMICDYFGNGEKWGVDIQYLHEDKILGTAGALSLIPEKPVEPFIVMNGDIISKIRFEDLILFHNSQKAISTMAVRGYDFQIPYGVVNIENHKVVSIEEKPVHKLFVNAGIYVLSPETIDHIPKDTYFDMPSLFERLISEKYNTAAYPFKEYWLDVGRLEELERAQREWGSQ